eukprot:COSAG04_NODE_735_length_10705_cov_33.479823_2_plen_344_part_00
MYATSKAEQEQPYHFASLPVPQADIDFFSDTKTKPTDEMRTAMATAEVRVLPCLLLPFTPAAGPRGCCCSRSLPRSLPSAAPVLARPATPPQPTCTPPHPSELMLGAAPQVGDEQKMEDPTTAALEIRVAKMLRKEAAVFLPSGTMCNEIALRVHCAPGEEVICHDGCHIVIAEAGGPAAMAGVMIKGLATPSGIFTADDVRAALRNTGPTSGLGHFSRRYPPRTGLIHLENTSNGGGGTPWPMETLAEVTALAKEEGKRGLLRCLCWCWCWCSCPCPCSCSCSCSCSSSSSCCSCSRSCSRSFSLGSVCTPIPGWGCRDPDAHGRGAAHERRRGAGRRHRRQ